MTEDLLTDTCGRALPRAAVIELARSNMLASSEPDTSSLVDDETLLQWATDVDGCFDDEQVAAYGHVFVTTPGKTA